MSAQSPTFWVVAGLVFFANALFSMAKGYWLLGLLQVVTAAMAAVSAAHSAHAGDPERGR
jgi:hypothetical protein